MLSRLKKGSSASMYYIACLWIIVAAMAFFISLMHATTHVGKTKMLADIVADGSAYIGNNGWGIDEAVATEASAKLIGYNTEEFDDITLASLTFERNETKGDINGGNKNNTAVATTSLTTELPADGGTVSKDGITSKTKITYTGGMKIVWEAYTHTYEYWGTPEGPVHYVWGGGHGIPNDSLEWQENADCSGFTSGVFRKCGYMIDSGACTWNMEDMGVLIGYGTSALENDAMPGDIILYFDGAPVHGGSTHVAIYAGKYKGQYWQCESTGSSSFGFENPGKGPRYGGRFKGVNTGKSFMVRRIVDSEAKAEKVEVADKYNLPYDQIVALSSVCVREQGTKSVNVQACASFICNLAEKFGMSPYEVVMKSGWFGSESFNRSWIASHPGDPYVASIVDRVINDGARTLPTYIDEYDWIPDIESATTNGVVLTGDDLKNRDNYVPHVTVLRNKYGSTYTFYGFPDGPDGEADPFGYTSSAGRILADPQIFDPNKERYDTRGDSLQAQIENGGNEYNLIEEIHGAADPLGIYDMMPTG